MKDTTIERGTKFKAHTHPTVEEFVVLDTDTISGYEAAHVAERDDTGWRDYWSKTQYLHDEANLGASEPAGRVDEATLTAVEESL